MLRSRIVCVGNRHGGGDWVGPAVFDELSRRGLPEGIELIDGGLAGLNLLRFFEGARRIVLVDTIADAAPDEGMVAVAPESLRRRPDIRYGHDNGLAYLLAVAPGVLESPIPALYLIGAGPAARRAVVPEIARACLELAIDGRA